MNIDNLMDQLVREQLTAEEVSQAYKAALDRDYAKRAIEPARANVMQALRKYVTILYGSCDEEIMNEFESTLKDLEQVCGKPTSFKMGVTKTKSQDEVDEAKLRRFLEAIAKF